MPSTKQKQSPRREDEVLTNTALEAISNSPTLQHQVDRAVCLALERFFTEHDASEHNENSFPPISSEVHLHKGHTLSRQVVNKVFRPRIIEPIRKTLEQELKSTDERFSIDAMNPLRILNVVLAPYLERQLDEEGSASLLKRAGKYID